MRRLLTYFERFARRKETADVAGAPPAASPEGMLDFWRERGCNWAREEASATDLALVGALADRIGGLDRAKQEAEVVATLKQIWDEGFSDPAYAFPWDGMNDGLSDAALVAFVEGAASVWTGSRQAS